jgi:23S rRNA (cytidine1920-2'-O)/16S rRNA (cytidine1409-2'-O)-methyltransferase
MAGLARVNRHPAAKPGQWVSPDDTLEISVPDRYVSRGGHKLAHALETFHLQLAGAVAVDLGASTGGFTDCLLQAGAQTVYAVDVGRGQLAWKLRQDARVLVMEGVNARHLTREHFPASFHGADWVVMDCSFISLRKILPAAVALLRPAGKMIALVKPQFEAGKAEADRGRGVILDPAVHERVLQELRQVCESELGLRWAASTPSPLRGPAGNVEFLVLIETVS